MARKHIFDPTDKNAIGMWMTGNEIRMFNTMTDGILLFIWIVGIGTLMAGIVGVSNIMLITVRERTREFGIRKAIGAKPASILKLVIVESIMITAIFGYIGMLMGIGLTELIDYGMTMSGMNNASSRRKSRRGSYLIPAPDRQPRDIAGRYRGAGRSRGAGGLFPRSQSRECIRY